MYRQKIDYLIEIKDIASCCSNKEEMKEKLKEKYPQYTGENYLDMTVGFFFPVE